MATILNPEYIRRANSASHFDAGNSIEKDAENALARFAAEFPQTDFTVEQQQYLADRRAEWQKFVIEHYNDQCRRRAGYMPVTVCGPARYPGAKMQKRVDKIMTLVGEFAEKAKRFFGNTRKALEELTPLENQLDELRAGKWRHGETIPNTDPHVIEKLGAMLEYLQKQQAQMKAANQVIRKYKTQDAQIKGLQAMGFTLNDANEIVSPDFCGNVGFPDYALTNNNANINRIRDRISKIKAERLTPTIKGWIFAGGNVVANIEADRLQILFDDRPDADMITRLKKAAFKWSPRNKVWQRQLTRNAERAAKELLDCITPDAV